MIGRLTGTIAERDPGRLIVDVGGVGYEVQISLQTFAALPAEGTVSLSIHTHVRDTGIQLFGFVERDERVMFERLQTVTGVGPRLAIGILSGKPPGDLARLIRERDVAGLKALPGIGKRTAERIVTELSDKMDDILAPATEATVPAAGAAGTPDLRRDAGLALVNLGYGESAVEKTLDRILSETGASPPRLEDLLKEALQQLARA